MISPFNDSGSPLDPSMPANAAFTDRFGVSLPPGLREKAGTMSWARFLDAYGHCSGPLRLGRWTCTPRSPGAGLGSRRYRATIDLGDRVTTVTAAAGGPVAAATAMLHDCGVAVETLRFHQMRTDRRTATFIRGTDGSRAEWAMGWAPDPTESTLQAVITCANRLLGG